MEKKLKKFAIKSFISTTKKQIINAQRMAFEISFKILSFRNS